MERYFVDERTGCIAVRDREHTDPEYNGLHPDTEGVIRFWSGSRTVAEKCPTCGHESPGGWKINDNVRKAAYDLCMELNRQNEKDRETEENKP